MSLAQNQSKSNGYPTFNELKQSGVSLAMLHARKLAALGLATNPSPFAPNLDISRLTVNLCG